MTSRRTLHNNSPWLLVVLAAITAISPLTIDMYLPALPGMVIDFGTNISQVQLTISSYLVGFAFFHLACGPLADRYGRKPVLLGGIALFLLAALACATATSIEELIFFRFLQGIGACVGPTLGRAMARDIFGASGAARALAYIAMIMALAPALAPMLGGVLLEFFHWSIIFYVLTGYAAMLIVLVLLWLPESLPQKQSIHPLEISRNYLVLLRSRHFMTATTASSLLYCGLIAYLSSASFIFIDMMSVPVGMFGLLFLPTVAGYIAGNALSTRLSARRNSEQVMWLGARLALLAAVCMPVALELWFHPASILIPFSLYATALGLVLPHAMATALRPYPQIAGTASALLGFLQMGLSGLAGALVGAYLLDTARPMTTAILVVCCIACLMIKGLQPHSVE